GTRKRILELAARGSLLRPAEPLGGIDRVLAIPGKLRRPAAAERDEQTHPCAADVTDNGRQPDLAVDLAAQERQSGALVQPGHQTQAGLQVVDGLGLHFHQLVIVLADPGAHAEVPYLFARAGLWLRITPGRQ